MGVVHTFARSPLAWHLAAEHIDEDGQEGERYGFDVDLDGERVIVGSRSAEKVFIYVRSDAGWMLEDTLTPSIGSGGDQFGYSVALDGDQALVGARGTSFNGDDNRGVAYIFRRSGSDWAEEQLLIASDGAEDDQFGHAVALDGSTALIGAPGSQFNFNDDQGQVYVFTQDVGGWSMQDKFNTNDMDEVNRFGSSLDVDGDTAVIGAALSVVDSNISQGLAFVFERQGGNWNQSKRLDQPLGSGDAFDFFGTSVAIDGDTLLVGASGVQAHNEIDEGIVYSYFRRDNSWLPHLSTMVIPFDESQPFDAFGTSVDLQGNTAIVGARGADTSGVSKGTAYLFSLINGIWIEQARFMILAGQEFDLFGSAVALDGQTVLIGAEGVDFAGDDSRGKAFLFERQPYELFQPMVIAE